MSKFDYLCIAYCIALLLFGFRDPDSADESKTDSRPANVEASAFVTTLDESLKKEHVSPVRRDEEQLDNVLLSGISSQ